MSENMKYNLRPFLKWAGGKRQVIEELVCRLPAKFNNFYEPFVGAGALFLALERNKAVIGDVNSDLIDSYKTIKSNPLELLSELDIMNEKHMQEGKEYYLHVRSLDRNSKWQNESSLKKAARLMYLNKYCFNGLYRVNSKNQFNVPFNGKKLVNLYSRENIISLSKYLSENKVEILCEDFEVICKNAKKGDLIYFDPPYDVLKKDTFDSYNEKGFGVAGQERLFKLYKELDLRGCYVMLSNHNTPLIKELYKEYVIDIINARRNINSQADKRGNIEEVIIRNY